MNAVNWFEIQAVDLARRPINRPSYAADGSRAPTLRGLSPGVKPQEAIEWLPKPLRGSQRPSS